MAKAAEGTEKQFKNRKLVDVAKADSLKQLGWRPEHLDSGWCAYEIHGDRRVGPVETVAELKTLVEAEVGNKFELPPKEAAANGNGKIPNVELEELDEDVQGNTYLPGMAQHVIPELANAIKEYHRIKMDRVALTSKEADAKSTMQALLHKHEDHLEVDPVSKEKSYRVGNIRAKITISETESVSTEEIKEKAAKKGKKE